MPRKKLLLMKVWFDYRNISLSEFFGRKKKKAVSEFMKYNVCSLSGWEALQEKNLPEILVNHLGFCHTTHFIKFVNYLRMTGGILSNTSMAKTGYLGKDLKKQGEREKRKWKTILKENRCSKSRRVTGKKRGKKWKKIFWASHWIWVKGCLWFY